MVKENKGLQEQEASMYSIGIITSEYSLHNIMQVDMEMRRRCKITYLPYSSMEHLIALYRDNMALFDGILFSGAFPYHIILEQFGSIPKPSAFFSISDRDYYRIIARIAVRSPGIDFSRVFFDMPEIDVNFRAVFPPEKMPIVGSEDDSELSYEESYQFSHEYYKTLWGSGRVDLIVTRFSSMIEFFQENQIRYELLLASRESMMETFQALLMQLSSERIHDSSTCVGIAAIAGGEYSQTHQAQLLEQLKTCNKKLGNLFLIYERDESVEMTTNLSTLKELTQHYTICPVSAHLRNALRFPAVIGWGCAESVIDAHRNAQRALKEASWNKMTCSYIMTSDSIIIGPLTCPQAKAYPENGTDLLARISGQSGLSLTHVGKIVSLMKKYNTDSFSAAELAQYMNLSSRNAGRILNALEQGGLASSYEKHLPGRKGRPAKVYRIIL